jgi:hypothetical protein
MRIYGFIRSMAKSSFMSVIAIRSGAVGQQIIELYLKSEEPSINAKQIGRGKTAG